MTFEYLKVELYISALSVLFLLLLAKADEIEFIIAKYYKKNFNKMYLFKVRNNLSRLF